MNEQTLSMRLERVAAHVPAGARLADIGSDRLRNHRRRARRAGPVMYTAELLA